MFSSELIQLLDINLDTSLSRLSLSNRGFNSLNRNNIKNVRSLLKLKKADLYTIKGLGEKRVREILDYQPLLLDKIEKQRTKKKLKVKFGLGNSLGCQYIESPELIRPADTIAFLDLSNHIFEALWAYGIYFIKDFINLNRETLIKIHGLTSNDIKEIETYIKAVQPVIGIKTGNTTVENHLDIMAQEHNEYRLKILQNSFLAVPEYRHNNFIIPYCKASFDENINNLIQYFDSAIQRETKIGDIQAQFSKISITSAFSKALALNSYLTLDFIGPIYAVFSEFESHPKYTKSLEILKKRAAGLTLEEVAQQKGVTRERIRQIEGKGVRDIVSVLQILPFDIIGIIFAETNSDTVLFANDFRAFLNGFKYANQLIYLLSNEKVSVNYKYNHEIDAFYPIDKEIHFDSFDSIRAKNPKKGYNKPTGKHLIILNKIEEYLISKGIEPSTIDDLYTHADIAVSSGLLLKIINFSPSIIEINNKKYIHRNSIIDIDAVAEKLLSILNRQFKQFGGYTNCHLLYDAAKVDLSLFMNDNGFDDELIIYCLTRHLFGKEKYHGNSCVFSANLHIFDQAFNFPKNRLGVLINFAERHDGIINKELCENYLLRLKMSANCIVNHIHNKSDSTFYFYDETIYILSKYLQLDDLFLEKVKSLIDELFLNHIYIIPRDIDAGWFLRLPQLSIGMPWTLLFLQEIIKYNKGLGYKPLFSQADQSPYRIAAAFVKSNFDLTLVDIMYDYIKSKIELPQKTEPEKLRILLRKGGFLHRMEWYTSMHKIFDDPRFVFSDNNTKVYIRDV
jgi:transcriptional regulator with XRE-family HTH domain